MLLKLHSLNFQFSLLFDIAHTQGPPCYQELNERAELFADMLQRYVRQYRDSWQLNKIISLFLLSYRITLNQSVPRGV